MDCSPTTGSAKWYKITKQAMSQSDQKLNYFVFLLTAIPIRILAFFASRTVVNQVSISSDVVTKHRVWYSNIARIPGNLFLRLRKAPVQVLSNSEWQQRESEIADATIADGKLKLERLDGVPLADFLRTEESEDKKSEAILSAAKSLFEFHLRFNQSHGDASASNVMIVELPQGEFSATWFDFDVAHSGSDSTINCADDLRSLICTTIGFPIDEKFDLFATAYPNRAVMEALTQVFDRQICDVFHLAQQLRLGP